jgi:hypothetical protein
MQFQTPACRLPGYRPRWIFGFDIRMNVTENDPLMDVISPKNP